MKKVITLIALAFTVMAAAHAQNSEIRIKARETEIPVAIVEAFKTDYLGAKADEWAIVPAIIVGEEYIVSGYDNLNGEKPTSYLVKIKGTNLRGEAVYDKNGKLMYSKEAIKDVALPAVVRTAVGAKYPGYSFINDQEIIKQGKSNFIHYRVIIEKGKEKMALAVDASGKILKEKKVRL